MNVRMTKCLAVASLTVLALAGCGSDSLSGAPVSSPAPSQSPSPSAPSASSEPATGLPDRVRSSGTIVIGTDASYAPNEFLAGDGKTVQGMDVDLFNAVAAKLGVKTTWERVDFSAIVPGVKGKKYDVGVSSFTVNSTTLQQATMVSYFSAGTLWATKKGNPEKVNFDKPCGKTVAVQSGSVQETEDLAIRQSECEPQNQIEILSYKGQEQATAAVVSGKADAFLADSPVAAYAVKQAGGQLEALGDVYEAAPYGYVLPKEETEFGDAIAAALEELKADGTYDRVLTKWGLESGAVDEFAVNPA